MDVSAQWTSLVMQRDSCGQATPMPSLADVNFLRANLEGDNLPVGPQERLFRQLCVQTSGLREATLRARGQALVEDGKIFRNVSRAARREERWPLCVPRVRVSHPSSAVSPGEKRRICCDLAREFGEGRFEGDVRAAFSRRKAAALRARSQQYLERISASSTDLSMMPAQYSRSQLELTRARWIDKCKDWLHAVGEYREKHAREIEENLDKQSYEFGFGYPSRQRPADDTCHLSLNDIPLRHISRDYPNLGFKPPGLPSASAAAAGRKYYLGRRRSRRALPPLEQA